MRIENSHFVITGGSRGIGLAVAEMAAGKGANLVLISRNFDQKLKKHLQESGASSVELIEADLASKEGVSSLVDKLKGRQIDILFNNAGQLTGGLLEEQSIDEIHQMLQVNVQALIHLSRAVLPQMLEQKNGLIINNASVAAFMHFPCASTYSASKAAVYAFSHSLSVELEGTGVGCLCLVTPGVKTKMFDDIEVKYGEYMAVPQSHIPPEEWAREIAEAIENDSSILLPKGLTRLGLWTARHLNPVFMGVVKRYFSRDKKS